MIQEEIQEMLPHRSGSAGVTGSSYSFNALFDLLFSSMQVSISYDQVELLRN